MLLFNEADHTYTDGATGVKIPAVSDILSGEGLCERYRYNPTAIQTGNYIHKAFELSDKGILDTQNLDERLAKCLQMWEDFKKAFKIAEFTDIEQSGQFFNLFAGTVDRVGVLHNKKKFILDIKSGIPQKPAALQTAGYGIIKDHANCAEYLRCAVRVHWKMDRALYYPYYAKEDFSVFMAMANIYHWKKKNNYLREEIK